MPVRVITSDDVKESFIPFFPTKQKPTKMFETFYVRCVRCQCGNQDESEKERTSEASGSGCRLSMRLISIRDPLCFNESGLAEGWRGRFSGLAPILFSGLLLPRVRLISCRIPPLAAFSRKKIPRLQFFHVVESLHVLIIVISIAIIGGHLNWAKTWSRSESSSPREWENTKSV
jgi:hypothetical protein